MKSTTKEGVTVRTIAISDMISDALEHDVERFRTEIRDARWAAGLAPADVTDIGLMISDTLRIAGHIDTFGALPVAF